MGTQHYVLVPCVIRQLTLKKKFTENYNRAQGCNSLWHTYTIHCEGFFQLGKMNQALKLIPGNVSAEEYLQGHLNNASAILTLFLTKFSTNIQCHYPKFHEVNSLNKINKMLSTKEMTIKKNFN